MKDLRACLLLCGCFFAAVRSQLTNSGDLLGSNPLTKVYASTEGSVYVLGNGEVYKLPQMLSVVAGRALPPAVNTRPQALAFLKEESQAVICWASDAFSEVDMASISTAPCRIYTTLALSMLSGQDAVALLPPTINGSVGAPRSPGFAYAVVPTQDDTSYFVMSADAGESTNYFHREFRVSDGGTIRRETPDTSSKINDRNPIRSYIAGLTSGTYTYFVASDEHLSVDRVRVIRICDADAWDNWYEVNLYCGETSGGLNTVSNTLIGANFVRLRSGSTALFWTINDDSNVRMCSVLLSDVDSSISSLLSACTGQSPAATIFFPWGPNSGTCGSGATISECDLENSGGPGKLSTNPTATGDRAPISIEDYTMMFSGTPTSVLTFEVDGSIVVFAGFSTGIVNRYVLSSRTGRVTPSVDGSWNITSSVVDLSRANESDYVYALTSSTVYQLPVEECDTFTNCSSCTNSGGGLCGWCTVENKCSRSSACSDSDSAGRWVNDVGQCLVATVTSSPGVPDDYPITTQSISVTLTNLPAAIVGEVFTCEFSGIGTGALTSNGGDSYTCAVPPIVPFPGDGPDTVVSQFSLRSSLRNIDFGIVVNAFNFYDCAVPNRCSTCAGRYTCRWCTVDFTCRDTAGFATCSANLVTQSSTCAKISSNPSADGRYYIHEMPRIATLTLSAMNLESTQTGKSYFCSFTVPGRAESRLSATRMSATQLQCSVDQSEFTLPTGTSQLEIDINILYGTGGANVYTLDSDQPVKMVIYNCGKLATGDCSACVQLIPAYNCEFCPLSPFTCSLQTETSCSATPVTQGMFQSCGDPEIQSVSPRSGPVQGGTLVSFTGMHLGGHTIMFGSQMCQIDLTMGVPGSVSVCRSPQAISAGSVDISVRRNTFSQTYGQFRYAVPVITGISPSKGPTDGGTLVSIIGTDLNIGNTERTEITVAARPCTSVSVVNDTIITCTTTSGAAGSGGVIISIDGSSLSAMSSVVFSRVAPRVTGIFDDEDASDGVIIASGGVFFNLTGINLDVGVSVELSLSSRSVISSTTECTAQSPTLLVCQLPRLNFQVGEQLEYSLRLDNSMLTGLSGVERLVVVENPRFEDVGQLTYIIDSGSPISLPGANVSNVRAENYRVTIGNRVCNILAVRNTSVVCVPPQASSGGSTIITVYVGMATNALSQEVGTLAYMEAPIDTTGPIIAGVVVGVLIIVVVLAIILGLVFGTWFVKTRTGRQQLDKPMSRDMQRVVMSDFESVHLRSQAHQRHSDLAKLLHQQRMEHHEEEEQDNDAFQSLDDQLALFDEPEEQNFVPKVGHRSSKRAYANELFANVNTNENLPDEQKTGQVYEEDGPHAQEDSAEEEDDDEYEGGHGNIDGNGDDSDDYQDEEEEVDDEKKKPPSGQDGYGQGEDVYEDYEDDDYDDFMTSI